MLQTYGAGGGGGGVDTTQFILLMIEIRHDLKDPKLWDLWYIPYYGSCRIYIINRISGGHCMAITLRLEG